MSSIPIDFSAIPTSTPVLAPQPTIADSSGSFSLSGLTNLFSAVGTSISNVYHSVNPPSTGTLVFNPNTGTYQPAGAQTPAPGTVLSTLAVQPSTLLLLVGAGLLVVVLLMRR